LTSVIDSAIETSRPLIDEKRQQLTVDLPTERISLDADPRRLSQVFSNLLNNAAKYTPNGGQIVLSARRQGDNLVVSVKDNGIGIRSELLSEIFDLFVQAKSSHESERGGLGLGLTLVRSLIELHGGSVEARSEGPDHGSEFIVRLPIAESDSAVENEESKLVPTPQSASEKHLRILVVDDHLPEALALLLQKRGHEVRIAEDAPHALQILQQFSPDVALVDIGLPGMNGYDLARQIREQPQFRNLVLVAQTGWANEEDRLRSREAGFNYHLAKPINHARLREILTESPATRGST
jgi:CheY-like chemotaxis protein